MDVQKAFLALKIAEGIMPTDNYLKKRYRHIVKEMHPDKFQLPYEKLHANKEFIKIIFNNNL